MTDRKIVDYSFVAAPSISELVDKLNYMIKMGYEPFSSYKKITYDGCAPDYIIEIVKYEEIDK